MQFLAIAMLLLLVSCSSMPPKTEAIHSTLVTDAALRSAAQTCSEFGAESQNLAEQERLGWWRRNANYVMAADFGLLQLNWESSPPSAEQQRAVLAMLTLERIQQDSEALVSDWFGKTRESKDCQSIFNKVGKGRYDVANVKKNREALTLLSEQMQSVSAVAEQARSINSRYRKYGRSLYIVEKQLKEAGCLNPKVALLRNSWPLEVYDAVCSQQEYILAVCNWGRCELKR